MVIEGARVRPEVLSQLDPRTGNSREAPETLSVRTRFALTGFEKALVWLDLGERNRMQSVQSPVLWGTTAVEGICACMYLFHPLLDLTP